MIEPTLSTTNPAPEEDVTTTLYRAAIGPVSSGYYLPIFTRFEAADHAGISWNTAASLLTLNWLVFRKLWVAALAYVGILVAVALLVFGIARLVFQFSDTLMMALGLGFGLVAFVLPGLFGNALFHTECRKAMAKALTGHSNVADARDALLRQASTRQRAMTLVGVNVTFLLLAAFVYQQFSTLSHVSVMPHGALEAGNVVVGRTTDATSPVGMLPASATSAPASASELAASAPSTTASAASAPASWPSSASASASASGPISAPPDSAPSMALPASQPQAAASATAAITTAASAASTASAPAKATSAGTSKAKAEPKPQASSPKASTATSAPAVQVRAAKEPEKTKATQKSQAAAASEPARKASAAASSSAADNKSFFINVGLFGVPENAAKAHAKLLEAGLPSVMKELKAKTRQIRVRVGPYTSQAQADAAAEKIKALQLDASIIQL